MSRAIVRGVPCPDDEPGREGRREVRHPSKQKAQSCLRITIENSQAAKPGIVHNALKSVAEPQGHHVHHYGMYTPEDKASLTHVMNGLLACNSMPGVFCGLVADPTDAFLFGQINDGNCLAMPYA